MADSVSGIAASATNIEKKTPTPDEIENVIAKDANGSQEVLGKDTEEQQDFLRYDEARWSVIRLILKTSLNNSIPGGNACHSFRKHHLPLLIDH
jgi:hypothetical protein